MQEPCLAIPVPQAEFSTPTKAPRRRHHYYLRHNGHARCVGDRSHLSTRRYAAPGKQPLYHKSPTKKSQALLSQQSPPPEWLLALESLAPVEQQQQHSRSVLASGQPTNDDTDFEPDFTTLEQLIGISPQLHLTPYTGLWDQVMLSIPPESDLKVQQELKISPFVDTSFSEIPLIDLVSSTDSSESNMLDDASLTDNGDDTGMSVVGSSRADSFGGWVFSSSPST